MACLNFATCEDDSSTEFRSSGGSWAIQTSIILSGTRSARFSPVTSAVANLRLGLIRADGRPTTEFASADCYTQFRLHIVTAPASNREKICEFADTGGSTKSFIALNSSRQLEFYNNAGSLVATGSTALALNTTYFIQVKTSTGSGNQPYEILIDEVSELSGTANQLTNNHGTVYFGKRDNLNSQTIDIVMDCFWCDDSAFVGDGEVARLGPTANGSIAQWTSGTGSSNYLEVDEIPPSTSDYIQCGTGGNQTHYVALEDTSTVGISGTILAFKAGGMVREVTSGTSSSQLNIHSGSSTLQTTAFNHSTSNTHIQLLSLVDPDTSVAWTTSGLDAVEIGFVEANAIAMRCFYYSGYVYYIPSGSSPQNITGAGLSSTATFGSATVGRGAVGVTGSGLASTNSFGAHTITTGAVDISGSGLASTNSFGAHTIATGAVDISGSGLASTNSFGAHTIATDAVVISGSGLASINSFGAHTITTGAVDISGSGLASTNSFGSHTISMEANQIFAASLNSGILFGESSLSVGEVVILASGHPSEEMFGSAYIFLGNIEARRVFIIT